MSGQAPVLFPVLLLAETPDLAGALAYEAALPDADPQFARFPIDGAQSYRPEDAKLALSRGFDGRPYTILLLAGEIAAKMTKGSLTEIIERSLSPLDLLVIGLSDDEAGREALASVGVKRVCPLVTFRKEFPLLVQAAAQDNKLERERKAEILETQGTTIQVHQAPKGGILRDSGVIVVHSTKGGAGKTTVSTNIAWALAASGRSTALVDLNADGAAAHSHLTRLIKQAEGIENPEELFEARGLSLLASRIRHDVSYGVIPSADIEQAMVQLTDYLSFLPGIRDQSDYRAGVEGADRTVANLLMHSRWVESLLSYLRSPATGRSYVVVDTGTARYTALGYAAIAAADLLILVVNASMPADLEADERSARELIGNQSNPLRCRRIIVANQLQRDIPGAPTLSDVKRRFEFFGADKILPLHNDKAPLTLSNIRGLPYLYEPKNFTTPLGAELLAIVNTISDAYDLTQSAAAKPDKKGFSLFGGKKK